MRLANIGRVITMAAAITVVASAARAGDVPEEKKPDGQAAFAFDFYHQAATKDGNVFFSPYSIRTALAMVGSGSDGDTAVQIDRALHLEPGQPVKPLKSAAPDTDHPRADDPARMKLEVVNAVWGQAGYPFKADFVAKLKTDEGADFQTVDFAKDPEAVRRQINHWADESTHGRVTQVLPAGSVKESTRMVLADAVYFKARWDKTFPKGMTKPEPFHVPGGPAVDVPMMHGPAEHMGYLKADGYTVVSKPYYRWSAEFVLVLPDDPNGLAAVEQAIKPEQITEWTRPLPTTDEVELKLPKFTMKWDRELTAACKAMGIVDAFDPAKADFSKMVGPNAPEKLYIGGVYHSAFVSVDEDGTEAAAVTAVTARAAAMPREQPVIHQVTADRPFLFMVVDRESGTVLFMGRVTDPR